MLINKIMKQLILVSVLIAATAMAQTPYDEGQKALREQNWMEAADRFEQAIKTDEENADASMYWRAHALYQAGRNKEAERQVRNLERKYPGSRWLKEAQVLQIEHDGSTPGKTGAADLSGLDEDLRAFALAQLMDRDPERALPLVLEMVKNAKSEDVRSDMLFVLGMSEDPKAQQAIADFARDSENPSLQVDAVHMLGIASNQSAMKLLADLYHDSSNDEVKQAVIQAHVASDEPDTLVEILKSEQDPELQKEIIHALGVMDATEALHTIYPTLESKENRNAVLEAFSIAGDTKTLQKILATESDPELRKTAIHGIAMEDDGDAMAILESVYDKSHSVEEKSAVLEALVMMDNAGSLAMKIVRTESDKALRLNAIHVLGVMEASEEMAALYADIDDVELRKAVLESMMIGDDTEGLINVLQSETNTELRAAAIQALAIGDEEIGADYLVKLYPAASREEKKAIIESMMIMENTEGLIGLLKKETDPELKREMLQMLTIMDSDVSDDFLFELLEKEG